MKLNLNYKPNHKSALVINV